MSEQKVRSSDAIAASLRNEIWQDARFGIIQTLLAEAATALERDAEFLVKERNRLRSASPLHDAPDFKAWLARFKRDTYLGDIHDEQASLMETAWKAALAQQAQPSVPPCLNCGVEIKDFGSGLGWRHIDGHILCGKREPCKHWAHPDDCAFCATVRAQQAQPRESTQWQAVVDGLAAERDALQRQLAAQQAHELPKGQQFLGVAIIEAPGFLHAHKRSHELGINPGGEMQGYAIPRENVEAFVLERERNRLLTRDEVSAIDLRAKAAQT